MNQNVGLLNKKVIALIILFIIFTFASTFIITSYIISNTTTETVKSIASTITNIDNSDSETIFQEVEDTTEEVKGLITKDAATDQITSIEALQSDINSLIETYKAKGMQKAGIIIYDRSTQEKLEIEGDNVFTSASLYKLFVLLKVQEEIEKGTISDDTKLILSAANDDSAEDGFQLGPYGSTITISYARQIMITQSNNTASIALAQKVGWNNIQTMLNDNGFLKTRLLAGQPKQTTPNDVFKYLNSVLDTNLSPVFKQKDYDLILDLLKKQKISTNLSPGLPKTATFAHKTGNVDDYIHDAGILYLPDGREVIIVAMTKGNTSVDFSFLKSLGQLIWNKYSLY